MATSHAITAYALQTRFEEIPSPVLERIKLHLLDSLGCALGALEGPPIEMLRNQIRQFGGRLICSLIGGGKSSPDRAACYNTALTRYLDFMDNFMAEGETCHPSDNIGSVLSAAEYAKADGKELLTALVVAYEIEGRLTAGAPIMEKGFDHTTQLAFSATAATGRLLGLNELQLRNALGMAGAELNALAITRAAPTRQWKGLASSNTAFNVLHLVFLAKAGVTGPLDIFEGVKGFEEALGKSLQADWTPNRFKHVEKCALKQFNAEVHSQSALEGMVELRGRHKIQPRDVAEIDVTIFHTAYCIIGGGEYGDRSTVLTKEEADHSLPYLIAVSLLDGEVWPPQFAPKRIESKDVQELMKKVRVHPPIRIEKPRKLVDKIDPYSRKYPNLMPCKIQVKLKNGKSFEIEKQDYHGFHTRPFAWTDVVSKFHRLAAQVTKEKREAIVETIRTLESRKVTRLMTLLRNVSES